MIENHRPFRLRAHRCANETGGRVRVKKAFFRSGAESANLTGASADSCHDRNCRPFA
jgi:hypothetical protein